MKRILVGLDGSPAEHAVLQGAVAVARAFDAQLLLFRAVSLPAELPAFAFGASPDLVRKLLEDAARAHLQKLASEIEPQRLAQIRVELNTPWHAICEFAAAERMDLIVIGSHGYGGLDRLLGTTAAKVVNHAPCAVLVIKPI